MTANGYMQLGLYLIALIGLAWPLGVYMARVYRDELPGFIRWLKPVENGVYRLCGVKPGDDMPWTRYAFALLVFNLLGFLAVYALQRLQAWLPLNPAGLGRRDARLGVQHRRQLRHQHQLAGLRRRVDDELPDPDAGARRAELRLRRHRHGRRWSR